MRVVVDFDDTLAFAKNREWSDAEPNTQLINKLNSLYDHGWQIDIYTARGSLSCDTRQEADVKYRSGIEQWLLKHSVKYHSLSFNKPLATYYIDDKGITPEDFINLSVRPLTGGLSGSKIHTDGKKVFKTDDNAHSVRDWYSKVKGVKTPKIHTVIGSTLSMDYIPNNPDRFMIKPMVHMAEIYYALKELENIPYDSEYTFEDYISRIKGHIDNSGVKVFLSTYIFLKDMSIKPTFGHGDFGITNMLFTEDGIYYIDPIVDSFTSIYIDAAKFIASLLLNAYNPSIIQESYNYFRMLLGIEQLRFKTLIESEIIRVYKYHSNKEFVINQYKKVHTL